MTNFSQKREKQTHRKPVTKLANSKSTASNSKNKSNSSVEKPGKRKENSSHPTSIEMQSSTFTVSDKQGAKNSDGANNVAAMCVGGVNTTKTYSSSYKVLTFEQFSKLDRLMSSDIEIHGQGTFPNISVTLKDFVVLLKNNLESAGIVPLDSIRLNGGAASHVIGMRQMIDDIGYNDLDLIFALKTDQEEMFDYVRLMLYATLRSLLLKQSVKLGSGSIKVSDPPGAEKEEDSRGAETEQMARYLTDSEIDDGYVQKMVKVCNVNDCWSLISLHNNDGENVEVKFVHRMKRQYEFSVDSFQIELDDLLNLYQTKSTASVTFSKDFYPTVMAESKYGKFDDALFHLNNKLVATLRPEEIRGGGLLKYCNLLLNGYHIADSDIKNMERYMCSRFFIDFPDANSQQNKLQNYLRTHLRKAPRSARSAKKIQQNSVSQQITAASTRGKQPSSSNDNGNNSSQNSDENKENQGSGGSSTSAAEGAQVTHEKVDDGSLEKHRMNFLYITRQIIDNSTVCLMNIERACTLNLLDLMIWDLQREMFCKSEQAAANMTSSSIDTSESGYFSENSSSISNSLSSPSHFSRSSSPGVSVGGITSRSSSPNTAYAFSTAGQCSSDNRVAQYGGLAPLAVNMQPGHSYYQPVSPHSNVASNAFHLHANPHQIMHAAASPAATFGNFVTTVVSGRNAGTCSQMTSPRGGRGGNGHQVNNNSENNSTNVVMNQTHHNQHHQTYYHNQCHGNQQHLSYHHNGGNSNTSHHHNNHHHHGKEYHHGRSGGSRNKGGSNHYNYGYSKGSYHHNNHHHHSNQQNHHQSYHNQQFYYQQHHSSAAGGHYSPAYGAPPQNNSNQHNISSESDFPPLGAARIIGIGENTSASYHTMCPSNSSPGYTSFYGGNQQRTPSPSMIPCGSSSSSMPMNSNRLGSNSNGSTPLGNRSNQSFSCYPGMSSKSGLPFSSNQTRDRKRTKCATESPSTSLASSQEMICEDESLLISDQENNTCEANQLQQTIPELTSSDGQQENMENSDLRDQIGEGILSEEEDDDERVDTPLQSTRTNTPCLVLTAY